MSNLEQYRASESEKMRTSDLLGLIPEAGRNALDVGAREGFFSRLLAERFDSVTALDLSVPHVDHPRVTNVAGDVTKLQFPDNSFDFVFCAEVLEHIPDLAQACSELARVAKRHVLIGVPFQQDLRLYKTLCRSCGKHNPPYGHVNSFTDDRLRGLFPGLEAEKVSLVGQRHEATNWLADFLMDLGQNPWGTYTQDEPCIHCGAPLQPPVAPNLAAKLGARLIAIQSRISSPSANWIHVLFSKRAAAPSVDLPRAA
ncbi:MAG: class I SAM-dependent methyltransferase [Bryobacteraceae bacterium]